MGAAPPPSLFRRVRESHLVVVTLLAIWLVTLLQYLVPMILLLPIALVPFIGKTLYRHVTGIYDGIARLSTLVPVFSWCGLQVAVDGYSNFVELKSRGNAVMLSTHCSRVDWLIGLFLGSVGEHWSRIGFVAEATTALMPIIGWSRLLFGDIFVTRAFHKDGPRIENNIDTFHRSGVDRLIFLAPEGFIADPGTSIGEAYIEDCDVFMNKIGRVRASACPPARPTCRRTDRSILLALTALSLGCAQPPMTHLLTPRYKGMQYFVKHAPKNVGSCCMAFVTEHPVIDPDTGIVRGGVNQTRRLRSAERSVPDLHTVFKGGVRALRANPRTPSHPHRHAH